MVYNKYLNAMTEAEYLKDKSIRLIENNFEASKDKNPNSRGIFRISLTEDCNFNCYFCHNEGMPGTTKQFDINLLSNILNAYASFIKEIKLVGGEPLMHRYFDKAMDICKRIAPTSITTNGSLIPRWIDSLYDAKSITVSVHSLNETTYQKIMGTKSKPHIIIDNIQKLISAGKPVNINCVLTKYNKDEAMELTETFADMGVNEIKFLNLLKVKDSDMDTYVPLSYLADKFEERYGNPVDVRGVKVSYAVNSKSRVTLLYQYCSVTCALCRVNSYVRIDTDPAVSYCLAAEPISIAHEAAQNDKDGLIRKLSLAYSRMGHPTGYVYSPISRGSNQQPATDSIRFSEIEG